MKNIAVLAFILFLSHCGYSSIYKNQQSLDFQLKIIETEGDYEMNNLISNEIKLYSNKEAQKIYNIKINTDYEKKVLTKDSSGVITDYNLSVVSMILIKEISKGYKKSTILDNYKKILITMNPIIPHLSNECLKIIENTDKITWPGYDEKQIKEDTSLIVIQINGKKRGLITTDSSPSETEIMKLVYKDQKIAKYLVNNKIKKQIYIKNKLINIII